MLELISFFRFTIRIKNVGNISALLQSFGISVHENRTNLFPHSSPTQRAEKETREMDYQGNSCVTQEESFIKMR